MALHAKKTAVTNSDDAADDLIYHITHDLRAPVRALTLIPDWIQEDFQESGRTMPSVIAIHLDTIREQTRLLDQMILDLRDFSRIGRLADPTRDVDLHELIPQVVAELPKSQTLSLDLQLAIQSLYAPPNEIATLFRTLLSNCLQHHDKDQACVTVHSFYADDLVRIDITDDGPGIPATHRERAFELMTTLYRREEGAGTGVGLAIAKRVVESLNGSIRLSNNPTGCGTCVQIALPAASVAPTALSQNTKSSC